MSHVTVSQAVEMLAAEGLQVRPREISDLFYARVLDPTKCLMLSGRRLIPLEYLPEVKRVLADRKTPRTVSA